MRGQEIALGSGPEHVTARTARHEPAERAEHAVVADRTRVGRGRRPARVDVRIDERRPGRQHRHRVVRRRELPRRRTDGGRFPVDQHGHVRAFHEHVVEPEVALQQRERRRRNHVGYVFEKPLPGHRDRHARRTREVGDTRRDRLDRRDDGFPGHVRPLGVERRRPEEIERERVQTSQARGDARGDLVPVFVGRGEVRKELPRLVTPHTFHHQERAAAERVVVSLGEERFRHWHPAEVVHSLDHRKLVRGLRLQ